MDFKNKSEKEFNFLRNTKKNFDYNSNNFGEDLKQFVWVKAKYQEIDVILTNDEWISKNYILHSSHTTAKFVWMNLTWKSHRKK